ncbi:reverse transcriptase domain-containing protein [Tanacetum coccineum]
MFPLSLTGEAKTWLDELNKGTIESWDELLTAFISRFFPPALFDRLVREILAFTQHEHVTLTDAWLPFTDEGSSNSDTDKIMARMDAMTMKMDALATFIFPVDFIILEMEEDSKVPLILGRPFLHTADAVIRVKQKQINLGVGMERMTFSIDSAMKHSYSNDDTCFSINVIDEILEEDFDALSIEGTLLEDQIFFRI